MIKTIYQLSAENKIEVFKTDVHSKVLALKIKHHLIDYFPHLKINFDLEDCDRIMRIESLQGSLKLGEVQDVMGKLEFNFEVLPD